MVFSLFPSRSRSRDYDIDNSEKKKRKYSRKDILITVALLSFPSLAAVLQLFTFISGPGTRYWTVTVKTESFGVVKVGALGVCPEKGPCKSGLGYRTGSSLGLVIPRFAGAGVFHFIVFWLLIIATIIHFFRLKSLHSDREKAKRRTHLVWALPALSGVLLLLCITVDYALIGALKKDRILDMTPAGTPVDGAVQVGGCVGLTFASLALALVWFSISLRKWCRSLKDLEEREQVETKGYTEKLQDRAQHKRNGLFDGFGVFTGGGGGSSGQQDAEKQQATNGGVVGAGASAFIANMFGRSDPNGPPKLSAYD